MFDQTGGTCFSKTFMTKTDKKIEKIFSTNCVWEKLSIIKYFNNATLLKIERHCIWLQNCRFLRLGTVERIEVLLLVVQKKRPQGIRLLLQPDVMRKTWRPFPETLILSCKAGNHFPHRLSFPFFFLSQFNKFTNSPLNFSHLGYTYLSAQTPHFKTNF